MKEPNRLYPSRVAGVAKLCCGILLLSALTASAEDGVPLPPPQSYAHDSIVVNYNYYRPIGADRMLDHKVASRALRDLSASPWSYNNTKFRLFRYTLNDWLEYSPALADSFSFVPGRVMWLKTNQHLGIQQIDLGSGVSFQDTVKMTLPSKGWVDFCIPYRFNVSLSSILNASSIATDSLVYVYEWILNTDSMRYTTIPHHLGKDFDDGAVLNSGFGSGNVNAFTIGNGHATGEIDLVIPPIPAASEKVTTAVTAKPAGWILSVNSRTSTGALNPVLCGFSAGSGGTHYYPKPPAWGGASVGVVNDESRAVYGHAFRHSAQSDGQTYELAFSNSGTQTTSIGYTVGYLDGHAGTMQAAIIDPATGSVQPVGGSGTLSVSVGANGIEHRLLAVGSANYISRQASMAAQAERGLLRLTPNPCRGRLTIAFSAGYEASRALCRIVDLQGRTVWAKSLDQFLRAGINTVEWLPSAGSIPAPGSYIATITEFNGNGKVLLQRQSKFALLP